MADGHQAYFASGLNEYDFVNGEKVTHSFEEISSVVDQHMDACADNELITPSICSTSFHTNSDLALQKLASLCIERGVKLQIHSNEHFPEVHDCVTTKETPDRIYGKYWHSWIAPPPSPPRW